MLGPCWRRAIKKSCRFIHVGKTADSKIIYSNRCAWSKGEACKPKKTVPSVKHVGGSITSGAGLLPVQNMDSTMKKENNLQTFHL